jgi:2-polyprenyl-6-methoxyphenol hydroxylase-like FAD-dependent oxidoreductase
MASADVVVVGGGIAGSALATVLAGGGLEVLVLERQTAYRDKVRGEVFLPWGAAEVRALGFEQALLDAGGGYATRMSRFEEWIPPEEAEERGVPLDKLLPGVPGSLNVGHPEACEALAGAAQAAGAIVVRGVGDVQLGADRRSVTYEHDDVDHEVRCRLVVGADGRRSGIRRQVGIGLEQTEPLTIAGGMLIEAPGWPADLNATCTEGDRYLLAFPRPTGHVRVYLLWSVAQKGRFTGPGRSQEFMAATRVGSVPRSEALAGGTPAGPCSSYPMNDSWCDRIVDDGVVLVGDAAGWNDPIIGQGVSIAVRDARMVSEVLLGTASWSPRAFAGYSEERAERLRRLRLAARLVTVMRGAFGPEASARRRRWFERGADDPSLLAPLLAGLVGPERVAPAAFTDAAAERILSV